MAFVFTYVGDDFIFMIYLVQNGQNRKNNSILNYHVRVCLALQPTYRYNGGNGDGNGFSEIRTRAGKATFSDREMNTGDKGRGSSSSGSRDPARHDDDFFRSSLDTLGSTGFRGLLDQSLRLGNLNSYFFYSISFAIFLGSAVICYK